MYVDKLDAEEVEREGRLLAVGVYCRTDILCKFERMRWCQSIQSFTSKEKSFAVDSTV